MESAARCLNLRALVDNVWHKAIDHVPTVPTYTTREVSTRGSKCPLSEDVGPVPSKERGGNVGTALAAPRVIHNCVPSRPDHYLRDGAEREHHERTRTAYPVAQRQLLPGTRK